MRKLLFGLFAAILGLGALAAVPEPAQAQGFSVTIGTPGYNGPRYYRRHHYRSHHYRSAFYEPSPVYLRRRGYDRPAHYNPRCTIRVHRYWDGFTWVHERRRHCW